MTEAIGDDGETAASDVSGAAVFTMNGVCAGPVRNVLQFMEPVLRTDIHRLRPLFGVPEASSGTGRMPVPRDAVLEGRSGHAFADDPKDPHVALLQIGPNDDMAYIGGDPTHPAAGSAIAMLSDTELIPTSDAWCDAVQSALPEHRTSRLPRTDYHAHTLEAAHLRTLAFEPPDGVAYVAATVDSLLPFTNMGAPWTFESVDAFARDGVGWLALRGGDMIGMAVSWAASSAGIEVLVWTDTEFRGRGMATALSARLLTDCLDRGIVPHWSATNPVSQHMADRLGYQALATYDVLVVDP